MKVMLDSLHLMVNSPKDLNHLVKCTIKHLEIRIVSIRSLHFEISSRDFKVTTTVHEARVSWILEEKDLNSIHYVNLFSQIRERSSCPRLRRLSHGLLANSLRQIKKVCLQSKNNKEHRTIFVNSEKTTKLH